MKIVVNVSMDGFKLSQEAKNLYFDLEGSHAYPELIRHDMVLVKVVETLGKAASGSGANLSIVEIPDGIDYYIDNVYGYEFIRECHRIWYPEITPNFP
ncbi:MAG: hypothetical protein ACRDBG_17130 [Waterburya sp.]